MFISDSHDFHETTSKFVDHTATSVNLYHACFETRFLRDVEDFYRQHSTPSSDTEPLLTYLKRVRVNFINTLMVL